MQAKTVSLIVTFVSYACFHASRKPPSIVKSTLTEWDPFHGATGAHRLGELDLAFLSFYAISMFFSGHIADKYNIRVFLAFGMVFSGFFTVFFGLGYFFSVHVMWYYMFVQCFCGVFQSIGWPCVVSVVGNWFGKSKRGLIMGIWNSHTSVGNIVGSVLASSVLGFGWGWSFVFPGVIIILNGVFVYFFLVVGPKEVGLEVVESNDVEMSVGGYDSLALVGPENIKIFENGEKVEIFENAESNEVEMNVEGLNVENGRLEDSDSLPLVGLKSVENGGLENSDSLPLVGLENVENSGNEGLDSLGAIGFWEAWRLPNVAPFAFCLFFSKLVAYTFLYWLPFYIRQTAIAGVLHSHKASGILSTIFDIGGVFGGILAGLMSDMLEARGTTSVIFLLLSIPSLIFYRIFGSVSMFINITLMFVSGLLVNGPYALITTAVAADLGTQDLLKGNSRALATVTAIIDGTGSVGAALGPLLAGYVSTRGWNSVFAMLTLSLFIAALLLIRVVKAELKGKLSDRR